MITQLLLENFKGFPTLDLALRPVTLLAGVNSSGKTSVIQALLLLKQIDWQREPSSDHMELYLDGRYLSLGTGRDVLYEFAENDRLGITCVTDNGARHSWAFELNDKTGRLVTKETYDRDVLDALAALQFLYVSAERWGPRVTYPYEGAADLAGVGIFGEYAVRYLIDHGEDPVENEGLRHPDAKGSGLNRQVQAWMGEISPGVRMDFRAIREAGLSVAGFGFERTSDVASRYYRPTHVGFGLTYSLPLVVLLLSAPEGSTVFLENPEAHLHPRGQSQLAKLIALASRKCQVIVETHSDHVMNGLRVAVKRDELRTSNIAFHYLERTGVRSDVQSPQIDENARLSEWPEGFFDEHERSLAALIRAKR